MEAPGTGWVRPWYGLSTAGYRCGTTGYGLGTAGYGLGTAGAAEVVEERNAYYVYPGFAIQFSQPDCGG